MRPQLGRLGQVGDMSTVEHVEATIGENHCLALSLPELHFFLCFLPREHAFLIAHPSIILPSLQDLLPFHLVGADFGHCDTGGRIRKLQDGFHGESRSHRRCRHSHHRVASTGHIKYILRHRRPVNRTPFSQASDALFRTSHKKVREPIRFPYLLTGFNDSLILIHHLMTHAIRDFFNIRRDAISPSVLRPVASLRIHQDRHAMSTCHFYHRLRHFFGDHPLAIVREHDAAKALFQKCTEPASQRTDFLGAWRSFFLKVETHHLLPRAKYTHLRGGAITSRHEEAALIDARLIQEMRENLPIGIVAPHAAHIDVATKGREIRRRIRRAAQHISLRLHQIHRHRRLRGNTIHTAGHIAVRHDVTNDSHLHIQNIFRQETFSILSHGSPLIHKNSFAKCRKAF